MARKGSGSYSIEGLQKLNLQDSQRTIVCNTKYRGWKSIDRPRMSRYIVNGKEVLRPTTEMIKPPGMWWATGSAWIDWCASEMPQWAGRYVYEVEIDDRNLLVINNLEKFEAFEKE